MQGTKHMPFHHISTRFRGKIPDACLTIPCDISHLWPTNVDIALALHVRLHDHVPWLASCCFNQILRAAECTALGGLITDTVTITELKDEGLHQAGVSVLGGVLCSQVIWPREHQMLEPGRRSRGSVKEGHATFAGARGMRRTSRFVDQSKSDLQRKFKEKKEPNAETSARLKWLSPPWKFVDVNVRHSLRSETLNTPRKQDSKNTLQPYDHHRLAPAVV